MGTKTILYGASGHCKVIIDILECNQTEISAIIDENPKIDSILNRTVNIPSEINLNNSDSLILSIGNNKVRKELSAKFNFSPSPSAKFKCENRFISTARDLPTSSICGFMSTTSI